MGDMSHLVTDDAQQLLVGHDVHQRREDADAAVGTSERVDIDDVIHLEVERYAVGIGESLGQACETYGIRIIGRANGVVGVHPVDILFDISGHLLVGERGGLRSFDGAADGFLEIELRLHRHDGDQAKKQGRALG